MGSKTFNGGSFICYAHDHLPAHVHGQYGETVVIVDLLMDGTVQQSGREDAIEPRNAKRSDVRKILNVAAERAMELRRLWERMHGSAS